MVVCYIGPLYAIIVGKITHIRHSRPRAFVRRSRPRLADVRQVKEGIQYFCFPCFLPITYQAGFSFPKAEGEEILTNARVKISSPEEFFQGFLRGNSMFEKLF